ncbi:GNAT family N-acetyltransferase [Salinarimonas sp.]|uniref:GNAT family N-acetyltransferase n=1 Tax=Salinarimonas sp. TaxID=2766526 RepID=UPI0032D93C1A
MAQETGWRPLREADLPALEALATATYPDYPERPAVLAERLALAPDWCFALEPAGSFAGYCLAHPWTETGPPALDTLLGRLPDAPSTLHLHDLVIAPEARGSGLSTVLVDTLAAKARGRFRAVTLVAITGKAAFWTRRGFRDATRPQMGPALASYDPNAAFLSRPL